MLLEFYEDVLNSWYDGRTGGEYGYPRPNPVLLNPSYRELERLLPLLDTERPDCYWHLAERYWRACTRRVLRCPRCAPVPKVIHVRDEPYRPEMRFHTHSGKSVQLRPAVVRMVCPQYRSEKVEEGIAWLAGHWNGKPLLKGLPWLERAA